MGEFKIQALQTLKEYIYVMDYEGMSMQEYVEEWDTKLQDAITELEELEYVMQKLNKG